MTPLALVLRLAQLDARVGKIDQALAGLDGVSQQGMDALGSLGQWAAEGGR